MQFQLQISTIPANVVLCSDTKRIAFTKLPNQGSFVDVLKGLPIATWKDAGLEINGKIYNYNTWTNVEGDIKEYFKYLLQNDFQTNPFFN